MGYRSNSVLIRLQDQRQWSSNDFSRFEYRDRSFLHSQLQKYFIYLFLRRSLTIRGLYFSHLTLRRAENRYHVRVHLVDRRMGYYRRRAIVDYFRLEFKRRGRQHKALTFLYAPQNLYTVPVRRLQHLSRLALRYLLPYCRHHQQLQLQNGLYYGLHNHFFAVDNRQALLSAFVYNSLQRGNILAHLQLLQDFPIRRYLDDVYFRRLALALKDYVLTLINFVRLLNSLLSTKPKSEQNVIPSLQQQRLKLLFDYLSVQRRGVAFRFNRIKSKKIHADTRRRVKDKKGKIFLRKGINFPFSNLASLQARLTRLRRIHARFRPVRASFRGFPHRRLRQSTLLTFAPSRARSVVGQRKLLGSFTTVAPVFNYVRSPLAVQTTVSAYRARFFSYGRQLASWRHLPAVKRNFSRTARLSVVALLQEYNARNSGNISDWVHRTPAATLSAILHKSGSWRRKSLRRLRQLRLLYTQREGALRASSFALAWSGSSFSTRLLRLTRLHAKRVHALRRRARNLRRVLRQERIARKKEQTKLFIARMKAKNPKFKLRARGKFSSRFKRNRGRKFTFNARAIANFRYPRSAWMGQQLPASKGLIGRFPPSKKPAIQRRKGNKGSHKLLAVEKKAARSWRRARLTSRSNLPRSRLSFILRRQAGKKKKLGWNASLPSYVGRLQLKPVKNSIKEKNIWRVLNRLDISRAQLLSKMERQPVAALDCHSWPLTLQAEGYRQQAKRLKRIKCSLLLQLEKRKAVVKKKTTFSLLRPSRFNRVWLRKYLRLLKRKLKNDGLKKRDKSKFSVKGKIRLKPSYHRLKRISQLLRLQQRNSSVWSDHHYTSRHYLTSGRRHTFHQYTGEWIRNNRLLYRNKRRQAHYWQLFVKNYRRLPTRIWRKKRARATKIKAKATKKKLKLAGGRFNRAPLAFTQIRISNSRPAFSRPLKIKKVLAPVVSALPLSSHRKKKTIHLELRYALSSAKRKQVLMLHKRENAPLQVRMQRKQRRKEKSRKLALKRAHRNRGGRPAKTLPVLAALVELKKTPLLVPKVKSAALVPTQTASIRIKSRKNISYLRHLQRRVGKRAFKRRLRGVRRKFRTLTFLSLQKSRNSGALRVKALYRRTAPMQFYRLRRNLRQGYTQQSRFLPGREVVRRTISGSNLAFNSPYRPFSLLKRKNKGVSSSQSLVRRRMWRKQRMSLERDKIKSALIFSAVTLQKAGVKKRANRRKKPKTLSVRSLYNCLIIQKNVSRGKKRQAARSAFTLKLVSFLQRPRPRPPLRRMPVGLFRIKYRPKFSPSSHYRRYRIAIRRRRRLRALRRLPKVFSLSAVQEARKKDQQFRQAARRRLYRYRPRRKRKVYAFMARHGYRVSKKPPLRRLKHRRWSSWRRKWGRKSNPYTLRLPPTSHRYWIAKRLVYYRATTRLAWARRLRRTWNWPAVRRALRRRKRFSTRKKLTLLKRIRIFTKYIDPYRLRLRIRLRRQQYTRRQLLKHIISATSEKRRHLLRPEDKALKVLGQVHARYFGEREQSINSAFKAPRRAKSWLKEPLLAKLSGNEEGKKPLALRNKNITGFSKFKGSTPSLLIRRGSKRRKIRKSRIVKGSRSPVRRFWRRTARLLLRSHTLLPKNPVFTNLGHPAANRTFFLPLLRELHNFSSLLQLASSARRRLLLIRQLSILYRFHFYLRSLYALLRRLRFQQLLQIVNADVSTILQERPALQLLPLKRREYGAELLARHIVYRLQQSMALGAIVYPLLKSLQHHPRAHLRGIMIIAAGRLTRKQRAGKRIFVAGRPEIGTLQNEVDYGFHHATLKFGAVGIKVWLSRRRLTRPYRRLSMENRIKHRYWRRFLLSSRVIP